MRHALFKVLFVAAVVGIAVPSYAIVLVHDTWHRQFFGNDLFYATVKPCHIGRCGRRTQNYLGVHSVQCECQQHEFKRHASRGCG